MATHNGNGTLRDLIAGTESLLRSTASYGGTEIEAARDRLKQQLDAARAEACGWEKHAWRRAREVSAATDGYVHENAWKSIAGAVLVGALAGACLMSEARRR
ncbi:YqjD family protein [Achromobacter xylosoxidans]|uniref:YqjD family protein n=1 Tax=Alcaligenes xylosoxydans xylosoxydans TaxID=85698 RepID=UPI0034D7B16C